MNVVQQPVPYLPNMAQCQGPRAQIVEPFLVFTYIWQEDVAKIPYLPGVKRNVNPAQE